MKRFRAWLCVLAAMAVASTTAACGTKTEELDSTQSSVLQSDFDTLENDTDEEDEGDDDAPIDVSHLTIKGTQTEVNSGSDSKSDSGSSKTDSKTASGTGTDSGTGAKQNSDASSADSFAVDSGTENSDVQKPDGAESQAEQKQDSVPGIPVTPSVPEESSFVDPNPEPDVPAEEAVVSGILYLDTMTFEGEGIFVSGDTMTITGEGTYILNGSMTGMVEVNTTQKVKLKLNGVGIENPNGPAIMVTDAKKLTITLIEGTVNTLSDAENTIGDGTICSNDTLEIKGAGSLYINAGNAHGISCDDDIIVKNGDIHITANKSGLMANDDITVSGGELHVTGRTNGIKSKGTLHISGGTIWSVGGPKENKSALYSGGLFTITGGCVYAVGCGASLPDEGTSTQCAFSVKLTPSAESGAAIVDAGWQLMYLESPYAYNTIFVSTPDLYDGMTCSIQGSGRDYENLTLSGQITSIS